MKTFEIVTEADARVLTHGETIALAAGGHITPLAADTLRERRITVVRQDLLSEAEAAPAPENNIRRLAVGSDGTSAALHRTIVAFLRSRGLSVIDLGPAERGGAGAPGGGDGAYTLDYAAVAASVADALVSGEVDAGIVVDPTGIGSAIAANKIAGIRAVMATSEAIARYSRSHYGANVLTLGATLVTEEEAREILTVWLETPMRDLPHIRRLASIRDLEKRRS